ncbi:MAG: AAA family ATPase [Bdellovibrionota bacterium]
MLGIYSAIPASATIILVGDKDQLPSVGPGRVFGDLISIPDIKTISLSQIFRRTEESSINLIAHRINAGLFPDIPEPDGNTKTDAYFISKRDPEEAISVIESLFSEQITTKFGIEQSDISILTPSNRGPLGTIVLNKRIQDKVNPAPRQKIILGDTIKIR